MNDRKRVRLQVVAAIRTRTAWQGRFHLALQGLSIVDLPNIARQVNKEVAWDIQYAPEETHTRVGHVPDYARVISLSGPPPVDGKPDPALSLCQSVYT